jgi:UDP-N-acetylglucosamine diphosphorylase/glucosamine-1-phosphate N-acetyltransferase
MRKIGAVILAGGKGTRMKSDRAKVLHEICGIPMIQYVVEAALSVLEDVTVVVGHQAQEVKNALTRYPAVRFALQEKQLGTGHAVLTALPQIPPFVKTVAILCGDTPLLRTRTLKALIDQHEAGSRYITVLGTNLENPTGYGRLISRNGVDVMGIVEEADADETQKRITWINSGTYCIDTDFLRSSLPGIGCENAQQEFYLTDVVGLAYRMDNPALMVEATNPIEVLGVNTRQDLMVAEQVLTRAVREGCENPLDFCRLR